MFKRYTITSCYRCTVRSTWNQGRKAEKNPIERPKNNTKITLQWRIRGSTGNAPRVPSKGSATSKAPLKNEDLFWKNSPFRKVPSF